MFNDDSWQDDFAGRSLEELIAIYRQMKEGMPEAMLSEEEFEVLIDYFYQEGEEQEAIDVCEMAQVFYPFSSNILLLKAEVLFHAQKFGQVLLTLDEYDRLEFQSVDSIVLRSDIYKAQHRYDDAIGLLKYKLDQFDGKDHIDLLLELSEIYDETEAYEEVFYTLKKILEIDYRSDEALHKISFWTNFTKLFDEGIALHQYIVNEDPYNALAWFNLGAAFQGKKEFLSAIDAYEFCIVIDPRFEFAYRNLADAFIRMKWYKKAIRALNKHIELTKPEDVIYEALGFSYEKLKLYAQARHYYILATELDPADEELHFKIGALYVKEGKWEASIKQFERALSLNKTHVKSLQGLGFSLLHLEDFEMGFAFLKKATTIKNQNITPWIAYIKALIQHEAFEEAQEGIEEAYYHIGNHIDLLYLDATNHFGLGKTKDGMIILENALSIDSKKSRMIFNLIPELKQRSSVVQLISKYKSK